MALTFVTNRTHADVDRLQELRRKRWSELTSEEQSQWLSEGVKGAYNAVDFNRVETAVQTLASELTELGFPVSVITKTNWLLRDIPTEPLMIRYLQNVERIRNAVEVFAEITPEPPASMQHLDYDGANRIEQVLQGVEQWTNGMRNDRRYTGESFCGE